MALLSLLGQANEEIYAFPSCCFQVQKPGLMREISLRASLSPLPNRKHYFQLDVISNLVVIKWLLDGPSVWPIINMIIQSPLHYSALYKMAVIQRERFGCLLCGERVEKIDLIYPERS